MDESGTTLRKRGFPPVVDGHTRILVLGSLPGELSLANAQYYGNPRNAFWRLMSELTGADLVSLAYPQRLDALLERGIGLWDVVAEAERSGSLDTNIRDRDDNDLCALLAEFPGIGVIAFNGGTAERLGIRVLGRLRSRYEIVGLPSSSPAHTMPFAVKLQQWSVLRPAIAAATFQRAGYLTIPAMLDAGQLARLSTALDEAAGTVDLRQMLTLDWCRDLAVAIREQLVSLGLLDAGYVGVQCTCFEKSVDHNWLVALHQDLSIPVKRRVDHPGLSGWSGKNGMLFVQPPVEVLDSLVALRLHVDECGAGDGALKVVPGSHRAGRVADDEKAGIRDRLGEVLCPVMQGGAMAMSPLLLHASSKATGASRRRVLHFLFGPRVLPLGLEWAVTV